jgi:hypothetical protein
VIEVDASFGIYNGCNPQANGSVLCHPYLNHNRNTSFCWYNSSDFQGRNFSQSFKGVCDPNNCTCDNLITHSVGVWECPFCRANDGPPHTQTTLWKQINEMCQTLGEWAPVQ